MVRAKVSCSEDVVGKPWDGAAQMYYFPYRWYSPSAARWLARDPLGVVDGPNVYGYAGCNPVGAIDPLGLSQFPPDLDPDEFMKDGCGVICVCNLDLCVCARVDCACVPGGMVCKVDWYILCWPDRPKEHWWDAFLDVLYVTCEAFDAITGKAGPPLPDVG